VLQISSIFMNVSKGELAKTGELKKAFGKTDTQEIAKEILKDGELQVGDKEREHELSVLRKEIANRVTESIVDPATQRPYPIGIIEKAMAEVGYSVKPSKNAKSQVLECIHLLQEKSKLPIQRARMRVRVILPSEEVERLQTRIHEAANEVEGSETRDDSWETTLLIDPSQYRVYKELLEKECKNGRVDIVDHAVTASTTGAQ